MPIVIVEGVDRVGKTTFCKKLQDLGFSYFKDEWNVVQNIENFEYVSLGKLDTTVTVLKSLANKGVPVVVDRLHLTELVYGLYFRNGNTLRSIITEVDRILSHLNPLLIHFKPVGYKQVTEEVGYNAFDVDMLFDNFVSKSRINNKLTTNYLSNDTSIKLACKYAYEYDFYFASPFFNDAQVEREEALKTKLRNLGYRVFSPKEAGVLKPSASAEERQSIFAGNIDAIKKSLAVFAITDEKDIGTIWEAGYAYGLSKPILYYAETLGDNPFNVMLAQSGKHVLINRQFEKSSIDDALFGDKKTFGGFVE